MDNFGGPSRRTRVGSARPPGHRFVVLAREGSKEAAGALFDRYWVLAWRTAYAVTADHGPADDAGQEAFVKASRALARFDEAQPFAVAR
jgi:DNA-directed RNA polymerase specialized sigma24 family protein